ncbi:hypothetical protein ANCDUO_11121 [Ancylostoma duodenale]|uniref:RanBP2-type domain-containing protein n=1 Tax=Ancylostoma duodenale TaxID=51022 RepID=A0A0C2CPI5_9BILA|nr:hypothetical protein ANCDUO_11121 [Ancylostoma duodenale]
MVKDRIELTKQQIDSCRKDEQLIADFIADAFAEEMNDRNKLSYKMLQEQVKHLEEEIEGLRKLSPRVVPPPRPARPNQHLTWFCVRCLEENTASSYRCRCSFPRHAIDPREAVRCNCAHCTPTSVDRMFVSPTPGDDDWLLVNKLGIGNSTMTGGHNVTKLQCLLSAVSCCHTARHDAYTFNFAIVRVDVIPMRTLIIDIPNFWILDHVN